jgi:hypothetical protein
MHIGYINHEESKKLSKKKDRMEVVSRFTIDGRTEPSLAQILYSCGQKNAHRNKAQLPASDFLFSMVPHSSLNNNASNQLSIINN